MLSLNIVIEQEMINYLQRLSFEVQSRNDVITTLIENHKNDDNTDLFTSKVFLKYQEELSRVKAEYELLKLEVEKTYVPKVLQGQHMYNWNVDFSTNVMKIDVLCECGEKALEEEFKE